MEYGFPPVRKPDASQLVRSSAPCTLDHPPAEAPDSPRSQSPDEPVKKENPHNEGQKDGTRTSFYSQQSLETTRFGTKRMLRFGKGVLIRIVMILD